MLLVPFPFIWFCCKGRQISWVTFGDSWDLLWSSISIKQISYQKNISKNVSSALDHNHNGLLNTKDILYSLWSFLRLKCVVCLLSMDKVFIVVFFFFSFLVVHPFLLVSVSVCKLIDISMNITAYWYQHEYPLAVKKPVSVVNTKVLSWCFRWRTYR